jgi:SH3-like domain-containing protein
MGRSRARKIGREAALRVAVALLAALPLSWPAVVMGQSTAPASDPPPPVQASGLPLPRFVSLKSDRVNLRSGPSMDYPTTWVFRRAGLPLEVIKEYEGWRQVRDADGTTGWVVQSFLSGRRTALVLPWELKPDKPAAQVAIRADDSESAKTVAVVEAGVIANLMACDGRWCRVTIERFDGYIEQKKLWGVYPSESLR